MIHNMLYINDTVKLFLKVCNINHVILILDSEFFASNPGSRGKGCAFSNRY